jgi:hypothetical protein
VIFFTILSVLLIASAPESPKVEQNRSDQNQPGNNQPYAGSTPGSVAEQSTSERQTEEAHHITHKNEFFAWCEQNSTLINLFSAVVVALFTGVLTLFTIKLWQSGEKHSERELRAYVGISGACIRNLWQNEVVEGVLTIKNYGHTPAYDVRTSIGIGLRNFPLKDTESLTPELIPTSASISPDQPVEMRITLPAPINATQYRSLLEGKQAIYLFCETRYRDVFRQTERMTRYCAYYRGDGTIPDAHALLSLIRTPEHNDGT